MVELIRLGEPGVGYRIDSVAEGDDARSFERPCQGGRHDCVDGKPRKVVSSTMCLKHTRGREVESREVAVDDVVRIRDLAVADKKHATGDRHQSRLQVSTRWLSPVTCDLFCRWRK